MFDKQWVWRKVNGELKMKEVEVKGYIIDLLDGLEVSSVDKHIESYES